jgi:formamidopyrimidine-DNA glycosylase
MPELPEVETIVRELRPVLTGKVVESVKVLWSRSVCGDVEAFVETIRGERIQSMGRRGKYIVLTFARGLRLTIHLKMTGKLLFQMGEKDRNYVRVEFLFAGRTPLYFVDVRKFGRLRLWPEGEPLLPGLGPDPLDFPTVSAVLKRLKTPRAAKTVLLDQRVLAGVGNIYADEALFLAGIHPRTPFSRIKRSRLAKLSRELPLLLGRAINNMGTTLTDYRTPDNQSGSHQGFLNVYGRKDLPCPKCGTPIARLCLHGRSSHFCPRCQPEHS